MHFLAVFLRDLDDFLAEGDPGSWVSVGEGHSKAIAVLDLDVHSASYCPALIVLFFYCSVKEGWLEVS